MYNIVKNFYKSSYDYMQRTIIYDKNSWSIFGNNVGLVVAGIDVIIFINKQKTEALLLGIEATKTLYEGAVAGDMNNHTYTVRISPENEEKVYSILQNYIRLMKESNPQYQPPAIKKVKEECFIATATYNDYDHPSIVILRQFRTMVLLQSKLGHKMIQLYYVISPPIARAISRNHLLRYFCLYLIITPLVGIVKVIIRKKLDQCTIYNTHSIHS